jgi:hypothetical protein
VEVTLDAGALQAVERCLERKTHPLREHYAAWSRDGVQLTTPSVAWAEFWRGRGDNEHFVAKLRTRLRVDPVARSLGEDAADALRTRPPNDARNSVQVLIDAMVMAHANSVYTADVEDLERLWDAFPRVRALVSAVTGETIRKR